MNINHIPQQGVLVASLSGCQQVTSFANGDFNFRSMINNAIVVVNKFGIDSCWETGNIIRIDGHRIKKETYSGESLFTKDLLVPEGLSIAQKRNVIPKNINDLEDEIGCWVVDSSSKKLYFLDKDLNEVGTVSDMSNPIRVISSNVDGGCFVFDDGLQLVIKVDNSLNVVGYHTYSELFSLPSATSIKSIGVDSIGDLWLLIGSRLTRYKYNNGNFSQQMSIYPLSDLSLSGSTVKDMDINFIGDNIFVCGGYDGDVWIASYNRSGFLLNSKKDINISSPRLMKSTESVYLASSGMIYKFNGDLVSIDKESLYLSDPNGMVISSTVDSVKEYDSQLPFTIETSGSFVPKMEDEEIMVVVRERVDMTAHGPNEREIRDEDFFYGSDDSPKPFKPITLPYGFVELKGNN